jgi:hypothetical protein
VRAAGREKFAGRIIAPEYDAISDVREKRVLDHLLPEGALNALRGVEVVKYEWLYRGGLPRWGVLAQQLGPHVPEAVSIGAGVIDGKPVADFHTVDFQQITAVELAAIQGLDVRTAAIFEPALEAVALDEPFEAGSVVCLDPARPGRAVRCAGAEAVLLGVVTAGGQVATAGRMPIRVSLENGAIQPGDLLAPSSTPGVAMRASSPEHTVGVALAAYDGTGDGATVLALVRTSEERVAALTGEVASLRAQNAALEARLARIEEALGTRVTAGGAPR